MNILKTLKTFVIDFDSLSSLIYLETYRNQIHILINLRTFFDCVEKVVEGHSLDENEILDVEQSRLVRCYEYFNEYSNISNLRMGGGYLASIRSMRSQGDSRPDIEDYFMELDAEMERRRRIREEQEQRLAALLHEVMCLF